LSYFARPIRHNSARCFGAKLGKSLVRPVTGNSQKWTNFHAIFFIFFRQEIKKVFAKNRAKKGFF
jgi:uncharacterized MAPEG superfamily protein